MKEINGSTTGDIKDNKMSTENNQSYLTQLAMFSVFASLKIFLINNYWQVCGKIIPNFLQVIFITRSTEKSF